MKSIKQLVAQYGSQQKLADAMGVHRPQVSRWAKLDAHIDEDGGVYIKTRSVNPVYEICGDEPNEWRDALAKALAVLKVNGIPLIGDYPDRCLREIHAELVGAIDIDYYDAGYLSDFGGGNVDWWQDYIRSELSAAHDFYLTQIYEYAAKVREGGE